MSISAYIEQEKRLDLRAGVVAATVANVNRKKGSRPYGPRDFFSSLRPEKHEQTPEQQQKALQVIAVASGARIRRVSREELRRMAEEGRSV
jgi:L-aminopeptidase/D-esterase-like protein